MRFRPWVTLILYEAGIRVKNTKIRPKNVKICFSGTFCQKKMREGDFLFLFSLPFVNKNDVVTMFRKNFQLLISGAESRERVHQNSTNQLTIGTSKEGKWRPD